MIALLSRILHREKPIDWNARLEADRAMREQLIGKPYDKRRQAALRGLGRG